MSSQPSQTSSDYDVFASLYDRHMGAEFAERVLPVMDRLLLDDLQRGAAVLDVCCGPGRVTAGLLAREFQVTAIDSSAAMLSLARRNAPGAQFVLSDIADIKLPRLYDAAVSTFNSLAHLYDYEHLARAFIAVARNLAPGGRWLFDLTMEEAYRTQWRGSFAMLDEHESAIVRPSYDAAARLARNEVAVFRRQGTKLSSMTELTIFQRCYTSDEVLLALLDAGFATFAAYDAASVGMSGERGRTFFLAQLP